MIKRMFVSACALLCRESGPGASAQPSLWQARCITSCRQHSSVEVLQSTLLALWLALCRHAAVLQSSVVACLLLADRAPIHGLAAFSVLSAWLDMPHVAPNFLVTVLVFGLSVLDVLNDSTTSKIGRDLDVVDLFCGRAAIHRAAASQGLTSVSFDKSRIPGTTDSGLPDETEDMSTLEGFMRALRLVLRLRRGGLLVMGPPCSSFVMLNAVNCKRNSANNYRGDEGYQPVQLGNLLATATAFLMTLAAVRHVEVVVENHLVAPSGSSLSLSGCLMSSFSVLS